jgi:hypothetical protein
VSQQALSRRVAALETRVGVLSWSATGRGLAHRSWRAAAARSARTARSRRPALATALGEPPSILRIDVWGPVDPPEAFIRAFVADHPDAILGIGMRRNLPAALDALRRHELDAVVGNLATLGKALAPGLSARLVATTPLGALVTDGREAFTCEDLRRTGLAIPVQPSLPEFRGFLLEFAAAVGAPTRNDTRGVDLDRLVERIGIDALTLVPATWKPPKGARARSWRSALSRCSHGPSCGGPPPRIGCCATCWTPSGPMSSAPTATHRCRRPCARSSRGDAVVTRSAGRSTSLRAQHTPEGAAR